MTLGQNLAEFTDVQLSFAAHIRNPEINPRPTDIEKRRMDIYVGLFYRNIESFILSAFPVLKSCLESATWDVLVREFVHQHESESPYFLEISQEFLAFLSHRGLDGLPDFALELAHYEWVELALDVAQAEVDESWFSPQGEDPVEYGVSPLALPLTYQFDVHQIGPEHQPETPNPQGCYLIATRDEADQVKFIESNPLTHRLLELLAEHSTEAAVEILSQELQDAGAHLKPADLAHQVDDVLARLLAQRVVFNRATTGGKDAD